MSIDYKEQYQRLVKHAKDKNITVKEVTPRTLADYAGMNGYAAKKMGCPRVDKKEIFILKGMNYKDKYETLRHELNEIRLMAKGSEYWQAHRASLRIEDMV